MTPKLTASILTAKTFAFIRRDTRLTPHQRLVVAEILDHDFPMKGTDGCLRQGEAWPSQKRLAGLLGISKRCVFEAIRVARDLGYWKMAWKPVKADDVRWKFIINYKTIHGWVLEDEENTEECPAGTGCDPGLATVSTPGSQPLRPKFPNLKSPITNSRMSPAPFQSPETPSFEDDEPEEEASANGRQDPIPSIPASFSAAARRRLLGVNGRPWYGSSADREECE